MAWIFLVGASLCVWALCGAVIAVGRRLWSVRTTLYVHLAAAPVFAFAFSMLFGTWFSGFDHLLRAEVMTGTIVTLDVLLVAPFFERSFDMFRSVLGTWLPFAAIFVASWIA